MRDRRNDGTISLRFLRELAGPCKGTSIDSWVSDPVYINVGGRFYELADFSYVAAPYPRESRVEIQAGREVTAREMGAKDRVVIDNFEQARERRLR